MADAYQKPPKHALNHNKLRLQTACPTAKGKYANLSWDVYGNNPRIVVATNDPALATLDRKFGRITAAMDTPTFEVFLELLDQAIASEGPTRSKIECYTMPKGSTFSTPPILASDVFVGKDQEGCVFISVVMREQEGWPVVKFIFSAPDARFHKIYRTDGTELSKTEMSGLYARAYRRMLATMMPAVLVANYVEPPPYNPGGPRGGNGTPPRAPSAPSSAPAGGDDNFDDLSF